MDEVNSTRTFDMDEINIKYHKYYLDYILNEKEHDKAIEKLVFCQNKLKKYQEQTMSVKKEIEMIEKALAKYQQRTQTRKFVRSLFLNAVSQEYKKYPERLKHNPRDIEKLADMIANNIKLENLAEVYEKWSDFRWLVGRNNGVTIGKIFKNLNGKKTFNDRNNAGDILTYMYNYDPKKFWDELLLLLKI